MSVMRSVMAVPRVGLGSWADGAPGAAAQAARHSGAGGITRGGAARWATHAPGRIGRGAAGFGRDAEAAGSWGDVAAAETSRGGGSRGCRCRPADRLLSAGSNACAGGSNDAGQRTV